MKETLISFKTAKLAKEKGFVNCYCDSYWEGVLEATTPYLEGEDDYKRYLEFPRHHAPTQSLLQKWLRDEHKIYIEIHYDFILFDVHILNGNDGKATVITSYLEKEGAVTLFTYESALEVGLIDALGLIE